MASPTAILTRNMFGKVCSFPKSPSRFFLGKGDHGVIKMEMAVRSQGRGPT